MIVSPTTTSQQLESLISKSPDSLLFHSTKYLSILAMILGTEAKFLTYYANSKLVGLLPYFEKEGDYGKVINSCPFYGSHGGIIVDPDFIDKELIIDTLTAQFLQLTTDLGCLLGMISASPFDKIDYNGFDLVEERNCQITDLQITDDNNIRDELMKKFHYKTRNAIRKGEKNNLTYLIDNNAATFLYNIHKENMEAIGGKAKPYSFFENLPKFFEPNKDYKIYVAYSENKPIAALLLFYFNGMVEYYTPVIQVAYRSLQPNSLLIYNAMKDAAEQGFKYWNWGGTWKTQTSLYRFKNRWGAIDMPYNYYVKVNNRSIYNRTPTELLSAYPYFFTIPFNQLQNNG